MDEELLEIIEGCYLAIEDFERTLDSEILEDYLNALNEAHTNLLTEEEEDILLKAVYAIEAALTEYD